MFNDNMENEKQNRIALLIDAENVSSKYAEIIFDELNKYGDIIIRRIYGNWSNDKVRSWMDSAQQYAMKLVMQENNISGKNASDICLVIDAMKLLHEKRTEMFCIVSSDSDFTLLAKEIRENGITVIGMGEDKTSDSFIKACKRFILLDRIGEGESDDNMTESESFGESNITDKKIIEKAIISIVSDNYSKGKQTEMGEIGSRILRLYPEFDLRYYGYSKLSTFIKDIDSLNIKESGKHIFVELNISNQSKIKSEIINIFNEYGECLNIGLLKKKLKEKVENVDLSIKESGVSKFSKYLKTLPYIELMDNNNVRLKKNTSLYK